MEIIIHLHGKFSIGKCSYLCYYHYMLSKIAAGLIKQRACDQSFRRKPRFDAHIPITWCDKHFLLSAKGILV